MNILKNYFIMSDLQFIKHRLGWLGLGHSFRKSDISIVNY